MRRHRPAGSDLLAQLDVAARAVGALDPAALPQVLDEVRRLRDQLQREVDACRGQVGGTPAPVSPAPVSPPPVAPATPTPGPPASALPAPVPPVPEPRPR